MGWSLWVTVTVVAVAFSLDLAYGSVILARECPNGYSPVTENAVTCRAAMSLVKDAAKEPEDFHGDMYNGEENDKDWPSGCYYCDGQKECTDGTWFNKHKKGSDIEGSKMKRFCAQDIEQSMKATQTLFLGDSDIDYWPGTTLKYIDSFNLGVGGETCAGLSKQIGRGKRSLLKRFNNPETVVLVCGENDLAEGRSVSKTLRSAKSIIKKITKTGARVVFLGTKPEPSTKELHKAYQKYDEQLKKLAVKLARKTKKDKPSPLAFVDTFAAFEDLGNPKSLYANDRLHLSSSGYDLWDTWLQTAKSDSSGACLVWKGTSCQTDRFPE